ncbi:MAG: protein translocase subunit SecF [Clostridia bacterium]|nr:protein translocase subunit SecF [Clostridia bacterium]
MRNSIWNTQKIFKRALIVYAAVFLAGVICAVVFGVSFDINFSGGTKISYSYTGDIETAAVEKTVDGVIEQSFTISQSTALAGDTQTFEISLIGKDSLSAETQEALTQALEKDFENNAVTLYNSTSVSPTIAGTFFAKSLVAVLITALLVVVYVGIRFRRIGGISAALTALCALVLDVLISFVTCAIFRLQIDSNYIAVVLTILGYSLNDTIVVYDRVRENERLNPDKTLDVIVNNSINAVKMRNFITTLTTFCAVMTIAVVAELYGLTSLRTFAIPMAFGLLSGCVTSLFVAGPLWVVWKTRKSKKAA